MQLIYTAGHPVVCSTAVWVVLSPSLPPASIQSLFIKRSPGLAALAAASPSQRYYVSWPLRPLALHDDDASVSRRTHHGMDGGFMGTIVRS